MKSYPVSYRNGSHSIGSRNGSGAKAFKLPRPYTPPVKPPASNDNMPKPANDNFRKALALARLTRKGRIAFSRIGYVGYALTAWELWRMVNQNNSQGVPPAILPGGAWTQQNTCTGAQGYTHYQGRVGTGPFATVVCLDNQAFSGARPLGEPLPANYGGLTFCRLSGYTVNGTPRYYVGEYFYRASTSPSITNAVLTRHQLKTPVAPKGHNFVLDPMGLPIKWPMPLPEPVPWALKPHQLEHPQIRRVGNHAVPRPRFVVRRPPTTPRTKESKVTARGGALRVLLGLQKLGHVATEVIDVVDAIHDALPKEFQAKPTFHQGRWWKASPQAKAKAIWDNIEHLDWSEAVLNLAKNEIGDRILGRANAKVDHFLNNAPGGRINRGLAF